MAMKFTRVFFFVLCAVLAWSVALNVGSCTHEDDIIDVIDPGEVPGNYGDDVLDTDNGWNLDVAHSSVRWQTAYRGSGALLSGRFNSFDVSVRFVENDPSQISFVGTVDMFTVNTGQPGRDTGCLVNTLGMNDFPTGTLTSKSVQYDNKGGYNVVADLSFNGVTAEVDMTLKYTGKTFIDANNPYNLAGLYGEFEMSAQSIFGIESSSIDNRVIVKIDVNLREPI
jgi:polyisoprenoid-binding protein YceI